MWSIERFQKMSDQEAEEFYKLYMSEHAARITALQNAYFSDTGQTLDYSPHSLHGLWEWAIPRLRSGVYPDGASCLPDWYFTDDVNLKGVSPGAKYLIHDIAHYFGEVFVKNVPGLKWGTCRTREPRYIDENQPVIWGFEVSPISPQRLVSVAAMKPLKGEANPKRLLEVYNNWSSKPLGHFEFAR
jgi:hypothetical protein